VLKKLLTAVGLAGLIILGGSSAALADEYPPSVECTATPPTLVVGGTTTVNCTGLVPGEVTITATGPGVVEGDLASIVFAAATGTVSVTKTVGADGTVSASLTVHQAGTFVVTATDSQGNTVSATVTATAAGGGGLPPTGGTVPAAAIWLGVGALGLGGIAVAAAMAQRRARNPR
jgi:hypothetical protein